MRALTILDMRIPVLWTNFFSMGVDRLGLEMKCLRNLAESVHQRRKSPATNVLSVAGWMACALLKSEGSREPAPPGVLPVFCLEPLQILTDKNDHQPARILL